MRRSESRSLEKKTEMRVVMIGGTGHIGSFLTPMLVEMGNEVVCVSRGMRVPYSSLGAVQESVEWLRQNGVVSS